MDRIHTKALRRHDLKTMDIHLNTHLNELSAYVTQQLHPQEPQRKLWEVYCGASRTSQVAESLGMEVRRFSYETGWDFSNLTHQQAFLDLQDAECPDEILLAPECKLWSRMQSLGRRTFPQQEALQAARQHHHDPHLMLPVASTCDRSTMAATVTSSSRSTPCPGALVHS